MNKNEIEITQAGVCRGVSEPGESVAEGVVGKILPFLGRSLVACCWEDGFVGIREAGNSFVG